MKQIILKRPGYIIKLSSLSLMIVLSAGLVFSSTPSDQNCFSIIVGKAASVDGCVIMAHNEDDQPPPVVNHIKIKRKEYPVGSKVKLTNGGELEQVSQTWAYIWSEIPEFYFSDSYLNEWGVCIASDACRSREDKPVLTHGGINLMLRRIVAQRAKTAREGVHIAGNLIERFGYDGSGRTYVICDPDEGWMLSAVNGKHWIAQKVPDDHVAVIANTYTIQEVDLQDTMNFLGSTDIIDYAISKGWYDPDRDGEFNFAAVYADSLTAAHMTNIGRWWGGLRLIAADSPGIDQLLPFSVIPQNKLGVNDIMQVLRDHYEKTDQYQTLSETGSPHERDFKPICRWDTQTSFVARLKGDIPAEIGLLYWVCLGSPCVSAYVPFHFGIEKFPDAYHTKSELPSDEQYEELVQSAFETPAPGVFWMSQNIRIWSEQSYTKTYDQIRSEFDIIEKQAFDDLVETEKNALAIFQTDISRAISIMTEYSQAVYKSLSDALMKLNTEKSKN